MRVAASVIALLLVTSTGSSYAGPADPPPPPTLTYAFEVRADLDAAADAGMTLHGVRRVVPLKGGTVEGPGIQGQVLPGGADWQIVHPDGVVEIDARYVLKTAQGGIVTVVNKGLRVASPDLIAKLAKGEAVSPSEYDVRATAVFETAVPDLKWLERAVFVSVAERTPTQAVIRFYKVN